MAITFSKSAPKDGKQRITSHLLSVNAATNKGVRSLRGNQETAISNALQIWTLGLDDAQKGLKNAAKPGDWQYLIFENREVIAAANLSAESDRDDVSSVSYGAITTGVLNGIKTAEDLVNTKEQDLEPRLLIIPAINFTGLWFHDTNNDEDGFIVPIPPGYLSEAHYQPISIQEFEERINKEVVFVQEQIKVNSGDSGGSGGATNVIQPLQMDLPNVLNLETLNLSIPTKMANLRATIYANLPYFMQRQEQSNWCWSAVGTSVGLLFRTGNWTQCNTASGCLGGYNCCANPAPCNVYGYLDRSLTYTKSFDSMQGGTISVNDLYNKIVAGYPVCTRVAWFNGGAHFMAITGVNGDMITIQDPIFGLTTMSYNSYPASYHSGGTWTTTYFCKPNR